MSVSNNATHRSSSHQHRPRAVTRPNRKGPTEVTLEVHAPRRISATGSAAALSNTLLVTGLISGQIPVMPTLVWPLVTLSVASMAYDLGRKAITTNRL
ncbi:G protein-coupled receptor family protein [Streptomyces chartreusis]|uniref:hypothetical protein n=1 Tax=Streptomyces chartreusis TaxID=1969 RepID=UPI00380B76E2